MKLLKFFCALLLAANLLGLAWIFFRGNLATPLGPPLTPGAIARSLIWSLIFASALYGIQKRAPIAWKVGWVLIAFCPVGFVMAALPSILQMKKSESPWVALATCAVGSSAVAIYWGFWWNRQKTYFNPRNQASR